MLYEQVFGKEASCRLCISKVAQRELHRILEGVIEERGIKDRIKKYPDGLSDSEKAIVDAYVAIDDMPVCEDR